MEKAKKNDSLMTQMGLTSDEQAKIKGFVGFTQDDALALKDLLPLITEKADFIVDRFFENIKRYPELMDLIDRVGSNVDRLKVTQKKYFLTMFEGEYGENYFETRLKIGAMHTKIGLTPRWYLGSYSIYLQSITPLIMHKYRLRTTKRNRALFALYKIIAIDSELVIDTYNRKSWDGEISDYAGQVEAINRSLGVIEFELDGTILNANGNFLNVMGYTLDEIKGKHHHLFVDAHYAKSPEYIAFWEKLGRGEYDAGVFERVGKGGKTVWLQSSYNPILDSNGKPFKIVKYAADITEQKNKDMRYKEQVTIFSGMMEKVAAGDLRERVEVTGDDELVMLAQSLNAMIESLSTMARQITEASDSMFKMLDELLAATSSQSSGASEQAAAVNETTSTLEEIKVASTQTLTKTQQLAEIAERTRKEGEDGIATVDEAVKGIESVREQMENIAQTILALSEQTQQIGEITSVVTNLAQQSKMLALNASIEAAKAGEAGKGFSVVASEVKELAEQSQQSTAQVQKILQDIRHATDRAVMATEEGRKDVDSGVILVQKSGEMMKQLGAVIHEAGTANQQIIVAVRQEVAGIEQTNAAMAEINKVINHFVNSTQQTKTATTELSSVAEKLKSLVSIYQLAQGAK
jgi:PAS domain S-box-containing protein